MEQKKGIALNQAFGAILLVVLIAVLVIIAIVVFVSLSASFAGVQTSTAVNESIGPVTDVANSTVSNVTECGYTGIAAVNCNNGSLFTDHIDSINITVDGSAGTIAFSGNADSGFNNSIWSCSYDYTWGSSACQASDDMIVQFGTYPVLVGLVGTIVLLGIIIGILVISFAFGSSRREAV